LNERRMMELLSSPEQRQGFAKFVHLGREGSWPFLIMELLGMSLEDSIQSCGGSLKPPTVALVAEQGIHLLAYMHSKGILHRDIKTANFMWGIGPKAHVLHICDFGLSMRYFIRRHVRFGTGKGLIGTSRFASISAARGIVQSRRDDLESFGHVLMYALRGRLPWQGLAAKTDSERLRKILEKKISTPLDELCEGFPEEFEDFMAYARNLGFDERPDYDWAVQLFRGLRSKTEPPTEDWQLEWLAEDIDPKTMAPLHTHQPCPLQPEDLPEDDRRSRRPLPRYTVVQPGCRASGTPGNSDKSPPSGSVQRFGWRTSH
jgi:serine/threonine protein kinase